MARLSIRETFEANHGSFDIRRDSYVVVVYVTGPVENGFVLGLDSRILREKLSNVISSLNGRYLDDIVGRATNENIGLYVFHQLQEHPISNMRIVGDQHDVEIYPQDIGHRTYPSRLLYERARSLLYRNRVDDAIDVVSEAINADNTLSHAYNLRGRCNRTKERWDLALPDFKKAIELDPEFGEAYRNLGNALYYLDRTAEMIPALTRAVDIMPDSALAINNRGFAYQRLEEWELALSDHTKAVELDPNYAEAHNDKAIVLEVLGRTEEAGEHKRIAKELRRTGQDTYAKKLFH